MPSWFSRASGMERPEFPGFAHPLGNLEEQFHQSPQYYSILVLALPNLSLGLWRLYEPQRLSTRNSYTDVVPIIVDNTISD